MALKSSGTSTPVAADALKSGNVANIFLQVLLEIEKLVCSVLFPKEAQYFTPNF